MYTDLPNPDSLLDALPDATMIIDTMDDRLLHWNTRAAELLEGRSDTVPKAFSAYLKKALPQFIVFVEEVAYRGEGWTRDVPLVDATGHPLKCELRARPVPRRPGWLLLTVTDLRA